MKRKIWYPIEDGKPIIEIKVDSINQLFDERDPTPFRLRDLDDDAVEYIVSSVEDIGENRVGRIRIYCKEDLNLASKSIVIQAVKDHFLYRVDITQKKFQRVLRQGFKSLLIGLAFLSASVFASGLVGSFIPDNFLGHLMKEGFLLLGWVSMWKPINIFLYEWWPLRDQANTYSAISDMPMEVVRTTANAESLVPNRGVILNSSGNRIA